MAAYIQLSDVHVHVAAYYMLETGYEERSNRLGREVKQVMKRGQTSLKMKL